MSDEDQLDVIGRILTGELDIESDEARHFLDTVEGAAERLAELRSVQDLLSEDASEFATAMAFEEEPRPQPTPTPQPASVPRLLPWLSLLTAAAAVVLLLQILGPKDDPVVPAGTGVILGTGIPLSELTPQGPGQGTYAFGFTADYDQELTAEALVWPEGVDTATQAPTTLRFDGKTWNLTPEAEAGLPDELQWQLVVMDALGDPIGVSTLLHASR
ncbi:MAG: hypothetical protein P1V81_09565 [Planctomycetota bacterium]|nr:hypothetical protein [Planctomycetota bacterium]